MERKVQTVEWRTLNEKKPPKEGAYVITLGEIMPVMVTAWWTGSHFMIMRFGNFVDDDVLSWCDTLEMFIPKGGDAG